MATKQNKPGGIYGFDTSLFDSEEQNEHGGISLVRISEVEPNPLQPRKSFDNEKLHALAESIAQHGMIQPIVVRPKNGMYMIVTGERRWRAARIAGLSKVPVIVIEADDRKSAEIALVENIQRKDLNPVEEARAYADLIEEYSYTQEEIARKVGKSRSSISNSIRLLALPDSVLGKLSSGELAEGHAKVLLSIRDKENREKAAETVVSRELSVRETEKLAKSLNRKKEDDEKAKEAHVLNDVDHIKALEQKVQAVIGHPIKIALNGKKGSLNIGFSDNDDLESILSLLCGEQFTNEL